MAIVLHYRIESGNAVGHRKMIYEEEKAKVVAAV